MRKAILLICMFQLIVAGSLWAQATTGSIVGRVTDPSGATVVGAQVVATNENTGVSYPGKTDELGDFKVSYLPPGSYSVTVTKTGFDTASFRHVEIAIDQKQLLNVSFRVGMVTEVVTITAPPNPLQTQSMETGDVINTQDILDLPLNGRNFLDLTTLTPGVVSANTAINSFGVSVNGQRGYANSIMIDGIEATTNRTQDITVTPSVDSVQEFKIITSAYSAEFGRAAGGVVSIQTKSGTNGFHGDAYEFFRPNFTAARPFGFGAKEPASTLKRHDFGGTLGGPIRKNKSFFFASYERTKLENAFTEMDGTPPLQMIKVLPDGSVDLSQLLDPGSGQVIPIFNPYSPNPANPQQFPGNIIPANLVSKAGVNTLFNFFPMPNSPATATGFGWYNNFQVFSPVTYTGNVGDGRFDHNFSDKDRLSVVYHYGDSDQLVTDPYHGAIPVPGGGDADQANHEVLRNQELSVSETHFFNGRIVNEARFGYTRLREDLFSLLNGHDYSTQFGLGNVNVPGFPATQGFPFIDLGTGYVSGGSTYKPFLELDSNYQFADNVTISSVGKHEFKFGGDFRRLNSNPDYSLFPTGFQYYSSYGFSATSNNFNTFYPGFMYDGGVDIADLLLGIPLYNAIGLQLTHPHTQSWEMHYYFQDTYKLSPKLTLYAGIRYEFQAPYTESNNGESNLDIATQSFLLAGRGSNSAALVNARWNNFGPRLGIAYQINSKTVIRAGYGFFYSPENDGREDILTKNYPFAIQNKYTNTYYAGPPFAYILDTGVPRITNPPIPAGASSIPWASISNGNLETSYYVNPNIKTGYSQSYNLTLQRELTPSFTVEAGYVGSLSHDLSYQIGNINQRGNQANVVTPFLGQIQALYSAGWAQYHSLQLKATKRASRNLSFLASYTFGHNIDNGPAPFDLGHVGNNTPQNPYNLSQEVASADDDIRHNFVFSGLYRLPLGRGQRFFGNWGNVHELLLGGWQINTIFVAHTGTPFNVVYNGSNSNCAGVRPDLVPGVPITGPRTLMEYFNTAAFVAPAGSSGDSCAFGNAGRNLLYGPGFINADVSLFKDFQFKESFKVQTRLEAFNATNTPHFANPNSDCGGSPTCSSQSNFGEITRTIPGADMRTVQLAVKLIF